MLHVAIVAVFLLFLIPATIVGAHATANATHRLASYAAKATFCVVAEFLFSWMSSGKHPFLLAALSSFPGIHALIESTNLRFKMDRSCDVDVYFFHCLDKIVPTSISQ